MPRNDKNKAARAERIRKVMAGLQKHFASANLTLAGTSFTPSALQAFLQADVDANDASTLAREKWLATVQSARDTDAKTNAVVRAIESQVKAVYGESQNAGDILAEFGFSPRKRVVKTADTKAGAAAKLRATRQERHTMGQRQKAKVKGTVPVATAGGASAGTPSPSGSGTQGNGSGNTAPASPAAPGANTQATPSHA
jgi:hypothetical protein